MRCGCSTCQSPIAPAMTACGELRDGAYRHPRAHGKAQALRHASRLRRGDDHRHQAPARAAADRRRSAQRRDRREAGALDQIPADHCQAAAGQRHRRLRFYRHADQRDADPPSGERRLSDRTAQCCADRRTRHRQVASGYSDSAGLHPRRRPGLSHLLSAFRGRYLWLTIKVSLMVMGAQGGVWAVNFWMPTYLRTVRHLSASGTGLYVAVQACGALIGFLIGAYLADAIGRKWTFMISAVATIIMVLVYLYVPIGDTGLLLLGIPLNASILMKFAPMGPYMTELYPTDIRGTGQGFCYNAGRAIGSVFMTAIGFATVVMPLGTAIALVSTLAQVRTLGL